MPSLRKLKKIFAHEKRRDKEMALRAQQTEQLKADIVSGKVVVEPPKPRVHTGMPTMAQMERMAMDQAGLHDNSVTQENVRQACLAMNELIHRQGNGQSRKQVMVHLPGEIRKVMVGRTPQEAYDFYWSLPEFQAVWAHLSFNQNDLKNFVNTQAKAAGKPVLQ